MRHPDTDPARLIVVTGIQAAGKSTVSRLLAGRFARGAYVEADALQRMIVSGAAGVVEPGPPAGEAASQLRLRLRHCCLLGRSFYDAGFTAVLDEIILGDRWTHLREDLAGCPFSLVVLAPRIDVVLQRDTARSQQTLGRAWATYLDAELRRTMAGTGYWLDTSDQTPEQSVEAILTDLSLAAAAPIYGTGS